MQSMQGTNFWQNNLLDPQHGFQSERFYIAVHYSLLHAVKDLIEAIISTRRC